MSRRSSIPKPYSCLEFDYLLEELSIWRGEQLENVAVNSRYLLGHRIVRQQWDEFRRAADGMRGERVQAKTLADFRRRHPGFVQHWDPASFGQPWLRDFPSAPPERRMDLDLHASPLPPALRSPLAMAFYWVRWLPRVGQDVPVFLPGFKWSVWWKCRLRRHLRPPALSGARCCTTRLSASGNRRPPRRWFRPTGTWCRSHSSCTRYMDRDAERSISRGATDRPCRLAASVDR